MARAGPRTQTSTGFPSKSRAVGSNGNGSFDGYVSPGRSMIRVPAVQPPKPSAMPPHEIAGLVERARAGDVAAFERLVTQFQAKVYTFAFAFTGSADSAQDLAQE